MEGYEIIGAVVVRKVRWGDWLGILGYEVVFIDLSCEEVM